MKILTLSSYSGEFYFSVVDTKSGNFIGKGYIGKIGTDDSFITIHNNKNNPFKIKKTLYDFDDAVKEMIRWSADDNYGFLKSINEIDLIAHRVVHGGEFVTEPGYVDNDLLKIIEDNISLAPLHNNNNLLLIKACINHFKIPQIAVFDNENFHTVPEYNTIYPIQEKLRKKYHIRKYGFHGLYHYENTLKAVELTGIPEEKINLISVHLGRGKSVAAIQNGKIIDSSCGFATLAGIPTIKRAGDIDAAVIIHLLEKSQISLPELKEMLYKHSGLQAIIGKKKSFEEFFEDRDSDDAHRLAYKFFIMSIAKRIAELAPNFNKIHVLAISGENARFHILREDLIQQLVIFRLKINKEINKENQPNSIISKKTSQQTIIYVDTHICLTLAKVAYSFHQKKGK